MGVKLKRARKALNRDRAILRDLTAKIVGVEELNVSAVTLAKQHFDLFVQRLGRPYYPLGNGWGLTYLSSGQLFFVNTDDHAIAPWIIMGGHWEPNVDRVLSAYVQPGMTVIDVGANMGYYSVKLGARIGHTGRLFAFEPNPVSFEFCFENVRINNMSSFATVFPFAAGAVKSELILTNLRGDPGEANLIGYVEPSFSARAESIKVEVHSIDNVVPVDCTVDVIKIDTQGFEPHVLLGSRETLSRSPSCAVLTEVRLERWGSYCNRESILELCGGLDKELFVVLDDGTLQLFNGDMQGFLLTRPYHENYFLVASVSSIDRYVGSLLRR